MRQLSKTKTLSEKANHLKNVAAQKPNLTNSAINVDSVHVQNNLKEPKELSSTDVIIDGSDWIPDVSALLALVALIISIVTAIKTHNLANKDFLLTHRPFVWVENFGSRNSDNVIIKPINQVMIMLLNSPAICHREFFEYYIIDNLNAKTIIETQEYHGQIKYPSEKSQYTSTSDKVTNQTAQSLTINQELERITRIDYSWLSSDKRYFFEAKWRLDKVSQTWMVVTQLAD